MGCLVQELSRDRSAREVSNSLVQIFKTLSPMGLEYLYGPKSLYTIIPNVLRNQNNINSSTEQVNPINAKIVVIIVQDLKVCFSVIPRYCLTNQNPLSLT